MARLFGTDGVRGIANTELSCDLAFKIGQAGACILTSEVHQPKILIGRDTRISGEMLRYALSAGICSVGAEAVDVGVITTPGLAYLVRKQKADAAVMISASHNSFEYNGIKWFNGQGFKLSDEIEDKIEELVRDGLKQTCPEGERIGCPVSAHMTKKDYIDFLVSCVDADMKNWRVVLDCANGAASDIAPVVFERIGAKTHVIFNSPDGCNINAHCGSTHPQRLQSAVLELGADVGFAFDGDADRLIAVDEYGTLVDGDHVMALCAKDMKQRSVLKKDTLVTTVMSNLGMKLTVDKEGINVVSTDVGDRYVLERMLQDGYNLGGEQSGHIIFADKSTTGDGILSALELLMIMERNKDKLSNLASKIEIFPQILINVRVKQNFKHSWQNNSKVTDRIKEAEAKMAERGRVLVRASGTEPVLRIMLEGEKQDVIDAEALAIARIMEVELSGEIVR